MPRRRTIPVRERPTISKSTGQSGMGVCSWFAAIFDANELIHDSSRNRKMTDEQILRMAQKEFPGRSSGVFSGNSTVNDYRNRYNQGKFTRGIPPLRPSFRRDKYGRIVEGKLGRHLLIDEEIDFIIAAHQSFRDKIIKKIGKARK